MVAKLNLDVALQTCEGGNDLIIAQMHPDPDHAHP